MSVLRQACSTRLGIVQKLFAEAPVLEVCFDASGISIRTPDIFAAYTSTVSGGVGTSCESVGAYLPLVRVPELAWREQSADEPINGARQAVVGKSRVAARTSPPSLSGGALCAVRVGKYVVDNGHRLRSAEGSEQRVSW